MKVVSTSTMSTAHATSEAMLPSDELTSLFPPGWPLDVPLARVRTCGTMAIEVVQELQTDPDGRVQVVYGPPAASLFNTKGMTTAVVLLALLATQPRGFASKDFLIQTLAHLRQSRSLDKEEEQEESEPFTRLDNVVSLLRKLLYPPTLLAFSGANQLRKQLVHFVRATQDSGPGYRLAEFPLLWVDVEAMETYVARARWLDARGEDGLEEWQAAYQIGMRGLFLDHEPYSDWAGWRRGRVADLLWQSVDAQWKRAASWEEGTSGSEAAARLLLEFWRMHVTNEDTFRLLVEVLRKQERFQQAEECYSHLCTVLDQEGRLPQKRTQETMTFLRQSRDRQLNMASSHALVAEETTVHVSEERQDATPPHEHQVSADRLLPETRHLIGREAWLAGISQMVRAFPAKKLVILQGPVGVGKSSELTRLATHFQQTEHSLYRVIWLPFPSGEWSGSPESALDVLIGTLLNECGLAPFPADAPRERLIAAFLAHLKQHHRPIVILLDNAECLLEENGTLAPCWEAFLVQFVQSRHQATLFLATKEWHGWRGRESVFVAETFVPPLTPDESVSLLHRLGLEMVPIELLQAVGSQMAGIPLLLEWTARLVSDPLLFDDWAGFDESEAILQVATGQESVSGRLQRMLDDPSLLGDHLASRMAPLLQRILEKHLSDDARLVLTHLAVVAIPLGKSALQRLCPRPRLLKELRDASLLTAYTNRVQLLPIVALTVQHTLSPEQRQEAEVLAIQAYTCWLEEEKLEMREAGSVVAELAALLLQHHRLLEAAELVLYHGWLSFQQGYALRIASLLQMMLTKPHREMTLRSEYGASLLSSYLLPYLGIAMDDDQQSYTHRQILDAVLQGDIAVDPLMEVHLLHILMLSFMNQDLFHQAQDLLSACATRMESSLETNIELRAMLQSKQAWLFRKWGDYAKAKGDFATAHKFSIQSLRCYEGCVSLLEKMQYADDIAPVRKFTLTKKLASFLNNLACRFNEMSQYEDALEAIEKCIRLQEQGYRDFGALAPSYGEKSQILMALGSFREALHFDKKAHEEIQRCADTGDRRSQEEFWIYQVNRGILYLRIGQVKDADMLLEEARRHLATRRKVYQLHAEETLMEIKQMRESAHPQQIDWQWIDRYRELGAYDAYWWWSPAGPLTPEEQNRWNDLFSSDLDETQKNELGKLILQSRQREMTSAFLEQREPRFTYPAIDSSDVKKRINGFLTLRKEIEQKEPNPIVRRLYLGAIEDELYFVQAIEATYERDNDRFWTLICQLDAPPTEEEMAYALSRLKQVILLGLQRSDTREISEQLLTLLQNEFQLSLQWTEEQGGVQPLSTSTIVASSQQQQMVSASAAKRFFEAVFAEAGFDHWQVVIDTGGGGVRIDSAMRRLFLQDTSLSLEVIRDYFAHEIVGHASRSIAGEQSRLGLLGINTKNYAPTEEGLTYYHEQLMVAQHGGVVDDSGAWLGGLAVGFACGVTTPPQTFYKIYTLFKPLLLLYRLLWRNDEERAIAEERADNLAFARCIRTFRGVPDLDQAGICNTADVIYLRGKLKIEQALSQDPTILDRLAVGKVALELLPDLQELGITSSPLQSLWKRAHDPYLNEYILSFEESEKNL